MFVTPDVAVCKGHTDLTKCTKSLVQTSLRGVTRGEGWLKSGEDPTTLKLHTTDI